MDKPRPDLSNAVHNDMDPLDQFNTGDQARPVSAPPDSPSSQADAGTLSDPLLSRPDVPLSALDFDAEMDAEADTPESSLDDFDADFNNGLADDDDIQEIPLADLDIESLDDPVTRDLVRAPDMDAPDTPGQIDIEALGDHDLDNTDLPADARLDPLEE